MRIQLTQSQRATALLIDVGVLLVVSLIAFGSIIPPIGDKGFWFYTALLGILVGTKLVTPFYVKPVDAVAYAVPAFIALMLSNSWSQWATNAQVAYVVAVAMSVFVGAGAFLALLLHGWQKPKLQALSNRIRMMVDGASAPAVLYCPIMIFAMFAYHYDAPNELVAVAIAMLLTTTFSVGGIVITTLVRVRLVWVNGPAAAEFGVVVAYQKPGIYLLRSESLDERHLPMPILVNDELTGPRCAYAVDTIGRENGHLCRAIELSSSPQNEITQFARGVPPGSSIQLSDETVQAASSEIRDAVEGARSIVGLVAPETTVSRLYIEITGGEGIEVGRLVSVMVGNVKVLYQIVAGATREEAVHQKNTYGFIRAQAQQVGVWQGRKFTQCRWLPEMHTPVRLEEQVEYAMEVQTIGRFPKTNYTAEIGDINQLVTHNTAILGILGVGKSMLAIELVERMLAEGIKVICLDLTNQYAIELSDYYCEEREVESLQAIREACERDQDASNDNPERGGSLPHLKEAIRSDLEQFVSEESNQLLKIYNPSEFVATRQETEPRSYQQDGRWQRSAGLYSVTPVQATQIISETALNCLSGAMSDRAKVCLVYEEAHALVPEWNSVVVEGDKRATSGTARAILQGRKYGLGCLLITQRTANVTKSILNQCNSIFAMRTFDETGKEFLSNYLGHDYANELSSLPERHAVFFGKASNCENPVLIALNDRADFLSTFRGANPPPEKSEMCRERGHEDEPAHDGGDDLPF